MARAKHKQHTHQRVSQRQVRKTVRRSQVKFGVKTMEVKQLISQRGRTHPMEAPLPGMPQTPQEMLMDSTALRSFKYYYKTKRLRIYFQSRNVYDYYDVPESIAIGLSQAQSKGHYFYYNIRTSFTFKRIR